MSNPRALHKLLFSTLLCLALPAHAAFITDKIEVPVYAEKYSQGAVLKKLLSGASVDILMKDGEYTRIRTSDGTSGWVEFKYITAEKPLGLEYLELRSQYKTLQEELAAAQQKLSEPAKTADTGISEEELAELKKQANDTRWMRAEMNKARERANKLDAELQAERKRAAKQTDTSAAAQEELTKLRTQNQDLEARLAAALLVNEELVNEELASEERGNEEQAAADAAVDNPAPGSHEGSAWSVSFEWFFGSLVAALIVGGIAGMSWLDRRIRERHGGFRIY